MDSSALFFMGAAENASAIFTGIATGWALCAGLLAWRRYAGLLAASLMGLGVSIYLGLQHHVLAGVSACSISDTFNCDVVNRSEYSELGGIPIAFIGAAFYAGAAALSTMAMLKPDPYKRAGHLITAGALLSVGYSVFLAWASVQLGAWCLFCISLYGVNLLMLGGGLVQIRGSGISLMQGALGAIKGADDDKSGGTLSTTALIVFIGSMLWYNQLGDTSGASSSADGDLSALMSAPDGPMTLDQTEPVLGDKSAPYMLVEFADFQCPYCGKIAPELHELVKNNTDIKMLFKHYPISGICNDQVEGTRHENSCMAAAAAECARHQGRFWEMDRLMFINQEFLTSEDLRFLGKQIDLDMDAFELCMASDVTAQAVKDDVAHAAKLGVHGTPALYLHGLLGDEWIRVEGGPDAVIALVEAHRQGETIPSPVKK